jgi:hypothetical protein
MSRKGMPMTVLRRLALLAAGSAALLLVPAATASAATELTRGVLRDASGQPSAGTVRVYAWPHHKRPMSLPLLGEAQAGASGAFVVTAADDARLAKLAKQRHGWLDLIAVGETPGFQGRWAFTSFIVGEQRAVKSVAPRDVTTTAWVARASGPTRSTDIRITAKRRLPPVVRAAQVGGEPPSNRCRPEYQTLKPVSTQRWALVGELNNAYNDGTRAKFSYGREQTADTNFGVGVSSDSGGSFSIEGETHVADSGELTFPTVKRRYARKLRSKFEFMREAARTYTCAKWDVQVRANQWLLGTDDAIRQKRALDRCDASYVGGTDAGASFARATNNATRWKKGAGVSFPTVSGVSAGLWLTSQSGFSRNVTLDYAFGGPRGKKHFICGGDHGKQSAAVAGRVWSGSLK